MGPRFNGEMLVLARQLRKMSQGDVVGLLNGKVTQGTLSKIEHGRFQPDDSLIDALARALRVRPSFLLDSSYIRMPPVSFHRKRQKLSARDLGAIHSQAEIYRLNLKRLIDALELEPVSPSPPALDLDAFDGRIDRVALSVRQHWLVPRGPIKSVTKLIENSGVIIVPFDFGTPLIDGFCQQAADGLPSVIFINITQPKDRLRYSICHELGHLVMHQTPNPDQEIQANRFASEFLMPTQEIKPQLHRINIQKLMDLKLYWGVSMHALVYKAWESGAISDRSKKYHFIDLTKRGFREREPVEINFDESPRALTEILSAHIDDLGYSVSDLSDMFGLEEEETHRFYPLPRRRPKLRLVV